MHLFHLPYFVSAVLVCLKITGVLAISWINALLPGLVMLAIHVAIFIIAMIAYSLAD